jgi:hypothetical protein
MTPHRMALQAFVGVPLLLAGPVLGMILVGVCAPDAPLGLVVGTAMLPLGALAGAGLARLAVLVAMPMWMAGLLWSAFRGNRRPPIDPTILVVPLCWQVGCLLAGVVAGALLAMGSSTPGFAFVGASALGSVYGALWAVLMAAGIAADPDA